MQRIGLDENIDVAVGAESISQNGTEQKEMHDPGSAARDTYPLKIERYLVYAKHRCHCIDPDASLRQQSPVSRLPFDPAKMKAKARAAQAPPGLYAPDAAGLGPHPPAPGPPTTPATLTPPGAMSVSQLAVAIDGALRAGVPRPVRVIGEVSNFTDRTHWYFALKDPGAVVSCVMFQFAARKAGFTPAVGQEVVATGHVEMYAPQGKLTLRVDKIEPVGAGALELAYRRLCEELKGLGWFDAARKRPLPPMPRRVAVITSRTGAALQDVLDTMRRRAPWVEVMLIDVLVQGAAAAPGVTRAIEWVSASAKRLGIDTLIVTRGGGSMEDLWAFNDRGVAEAIVRCAIPVAAAIGHETDTTIAELVADARCATPTQAAMRCTPDGAALREQVETNGARLAGALKARAVAAGKELAALERHAKSASHGRVLVAARRMEQRAARLERHRPGAVYATRRARVDAATKALRLAVAARVKSHNADVLAERLRGAGAVLLSKQREHLDGLARQLALVGPESVLSRGYSITFGPDGAAIRKAEAVKPGQAISTKLADGTIHSVVAGLAEVGVRHGRRRKPAAPDPNQGGLFGDETSDVRRQT